MVHPDVAEGNIESFKLDHGGQSLIFIVDLFFVVVLTTIDSVKQLPRRLRVATILK